MPSLGTFDLVFLLLLIVVYISFSLGYRRGLLQGNLEGRIDKVLDLKEKSLLLGQCNLCWNMQDSSETTAKNGTIMRDKHSCRGL